jgi:carbon monoxide dehydrogenase subunit G
MEEQFGRLLKVLAGVSQIAKGDEEFKLSCRLSLGPVSHQEHMAGSCLFIVPVFNR